MCSPAAPPTENIVTQIDKWQSIRLGVSAKARLWERFKLGGDFAFLPYVYYNGLDIHRARDLYFCLKELLAEVKAQKASRSRE